MGSAVPSSVGAVRFVMPSPVTPLSLAGSRLGAVGADGPGRPPKTTAELVKRRPGSHVLECKPVSTVRPWIDFNVGDWGSVYASIALRGGIAAQLQRVYGFTLTL